MTKLDILAISMTVLLVSSTPLPTNVSDTKGPPTVIDMEPTATAYIRPPALVFRPPLAVFRITSPYGERANLFVEGVKENHTGVDIIPLSNDLNVYATKSGIVDTHYPVPGVHSGVYYKGHPSYGGMIILDHRDGSMSMYGHLSQTFVHEGQYVEAGQIIGVVGKTGIATGVHLHFEIRIDPMLLIS
jgi:murein DD-endopeptidase MepM/ murein hydrolase activator NlpD